MAIKRRIQGFTDETAPAYSGNVHADRTINLYPEIVSANGENPERLVLYGTPGLKVFATLADGPVRAQHTEVNQYPSVDRVFAVSGATFFEIFEDGSSTERGTLLNDGFPAYIASDGVQLVIASFQTGYHYDLETDVFSGPLLDDNGDQIHPIYVVALAHRFVANLVSADQRQTIFYTELDDGTSWPALNFFQADLLPDNVIALLADHEQLWVFGDSSVQPFAPTTDPDEPFTTIAGSLIETGCASPASPVKLDNTIFWIGGDERGRAIVWRLVGYAAKRVSTHAIENLIRKMPAIWDCRGYSYTENGHAFAVFCFPLGRNTLVYDASNGKWHERGCWEDATGSFDAHHAWNHTFGWGKHLVGDRGGECCSDVTGNPPGVLLIQTTCPITDGNVDTSYDVTFTAVGGLPPYTWALISGAFPAGLTFGSDGTLTGTPTESGVFTFTVQVTDSSVPPLTDEKTCQITVTAFVLPATCPATLVDVTCYDDSMQGRADSIDIGTDWTQWHGVIDVGLGAQNYVRFTIFENELLALRQPPTPAVTDTQSYTQVAAWTAFDANAKYGSAQMTFDFSEVDELSFDSGGPTIQASSGVAVRIHQVGIGAEADNNSSYYALAYSEVRSVTPPYAVTQASLRLTKNIAVTGNELLAEVFVTEFGGGEKIRLTVANFTPTAGIYAGQEIVCLHAYLDLGDGDVLEINYTDGATPFLTGKIGIAVPGEANLSSYGYALHWYDWHGCELGL